MNTLPGGKPLIAFMSTLACGGLFAYLSLASNLFLNNLSNFSLRLWFIVNLVVFCVLVVIGKRLIKAVGGPRRLGLFGLSAASALMTIMLADIGYNLKLNLYGNPLPFRYSVTSQTGALEANLGIPRYQTDDGGRNKPDVIIGGRIFGELVPPILADSFAGLPPVEPDHFKSWLKAEATELKFEYLDLTVPLLDASERELVYFRDDTHWNARGHEIAAEAIRLRLTE